MSDFDRSWIASAQTKAEIVARAKAKLTKLGKKRGRARCFCGPKESRTMLVVLSETKHQSARAWCSECGFKLVE